MRLFLLWFKRILLVAGFLACALTALAEIKVGDFKGSKAIMLGILFIALCFADGFFCLKFEFSNRWIPKLGIIVQIIFSLFMMSFGAGSYFFVFFVLIGCFFVHLGINGTVDFFKGIKKVMDFFLSFQKKS